MFCYSVTKTEKNNLEQRYAMKLRPKVGEGATDTYKMIQKAFGNDSLSRAKILRWNKGFVSGRGTVEDELRSGSPPPPASVRTSTNVDLVRAFLR
jgi:hypothetical protein